MCKGKYFDIELKKKLLNPNLITYVDLCHSLKFKLIEKENEKHEVKNKK